MTVKEIASGIITDQSNGKKEYKYVTASLNNKNGTTHIYIPETKQRYGLEELYIVGPLYNVTGKTNATLVLNLKSTNDISNKFPSSIFFAFPLNISTAKKMDKNVVSGILDGVDDQSITAVDLSPLMSGGNMDFDYTDNKANVNKDLLNVGVYISGSILPVPSSAENENAKWITGEMQRSSGDYSPVNLSVFVPTVDTFSTLTEPFLVENMTAASGTENANISEGDQIYIKCAPTGSADGEHIVSGEGGHGKGKGASSDQSMAFVFVTMFVIFIDVIVVGFGYKYIYGYISKFFRENIIENSSSEHSDKRRNVLQMMGLWFFDLFPFSGLLWGEKKRDDDPKILTVRYFSLFIYALFVLLFMVGLNNRNTTILHIVLVCFFVLVFDVLFFFVQISQMKFPEYLNLKNFNSNTSPGV